MCDIRKIKRAKLIYTVVAVSAAVLALLFIVLTEVFLSSGLYVAMFIMHALAALSCYTVVFSAFAACDRALAQRFVAIVQEVGVENTAEISWKMSWHPDATAKFLKKCRKWGYID